MHNFQVRNAIRIRGEKAGEIGQRSGGLNAKSNAGSGEKEGGRGL